MSSAVGVLDLFSMTDADFLGEEKQSESLRCVLVFFEKLNDGFVRL